VYDGHACVQGRERDRQKQVHAVFLCSTFKLTIPLFIGKFMIHLRPLNPWGKALDNVVGEFDKRHGKLEQEVQLARDQAALARDQAAKRRELGTSETAIHIPLRLTAGLKESKRDTLILPDIFADCASKHELCRAMIASHDSGRWLLLRSEYKEWKSGTWNQDSNSLWITGNGVFSRGCVSF
jgi:hypothetical protein